MEPAAALAVEVAVTVLVPIMVAAALVSFGAVEPDVRLLMTKPTGIANGALLPWVASSQAPLVKLTEPQQDSVGENGNSPIPSSLFTG